MGFGLSSFGLSPYGTGTPETSAVPASGAAGSRYINPATRDYQQDPTTGQLAQMPSTRQRVLLALLTVQGSSSVYGRFGIKLPRKMGTSFEVEMRFAVRAALRHLTDAEKVIRIDSITVERGAGSRSRTTVSYTDLATGETDQASI